MIIGRLENGNWKLDFDDYSKVLTNAELESVIQNGMVVKTNLLTEAEYQELHENIESKRTGRGLMKINCELLQRAKQ